MDRCVVLHKPLAWPVDVPKPLLLMLEYNFELYTYAVQLLCRGLLLLADYAKLGLLELLILTPMLYELAGEQW